LNQKKIAQKEKKKDLRSKKPDDQKERVNWKEKSAAAREHAHAKLAIKTQARGSHGTVQSQQFVAVQTGKLHTIAAAGGTSLRYGALCQAVPKGRERGANAASGKIALGGNESRSRKRSKNQGRSHTSWEKGLKHE